MSTGNAFASVLRNNFDRNFGGTVFGVADPYVSGYHFSKFVKLPSTLINFVSYGDGVKPAEILSSETQISNFLAGSCLSVTPPGGTLEKTEFTGLGGIKYNVPTTVTYTNSLTMKFLEFSSLPVLSIMSGWVRMIRDYRTGASHLAGSAGSVAEYSKANYAGTLLYWTTKPDGRTVEFSALYTGVFPTKDPMDLYTGDLAAVDKLEVDIEFNVDYAWHENWVHQKAQAAADSYWEAGYADRFRGQSNAGAEMP